MSTAPAGEHPRIWIPNGEVENRMTLAVELPAGMERPTKGEHYDLMEGKLVNLLAMNSDAENKRTIVTHVREDRDLVWGGSDGHAGGLMATDSTLGILNEIDWQAEKELTEADSD